MYLFAGLRAGAQASVNENESASIYVDANKGLDNNPGTAASPFKSIQAAINQANALNRSGIGVKVVISPGVYRESVTVSGYNQTSSPLTIEAASTGMAVIAGSDVLTGWTQQSAGVYSTSWTANLGFCAIPTGWPTNFSPIVQRAEMVFVNGTPLTEVMSQAELTPGTFYVDDAANLVYIAPDPSTDMRTVLVEASVRRSTINVAGRSNVVLRGLVFRHAANCLNSASAAVNGSTNVLVDSVQALWNNWGGLGAFSSSNVTVQSSIASYNGGVGFMGNKDKSILVSFNESDYNNWRGAQGAFYDWAMGGIKLFAMRGTTVQNHFSYNNQAQGLWFDTDNKNITIKNVTLSGNVLAGAQIERNEGPIKIQDSKLCSSGAGVNILTSQNVTMQNNAFFNNGGTGRTNQAQIFVAGQAGGILVTDWQTGQVYDLFTTGTVLQGNTIVDGGSNQFGFGTYLTGSDWTQFATTLTAANNTWYDGTTTTSFKLLNGQKVNLQGWQAAVGTDYSSTWSMPTTPQPASCNAPAPAIADFSMDATNRAYTMTAGTAVATVHVNSFGLGPVNLRLSGVPAGVTAAVSQQNPVSGTATITFTSSMAATTQNAPITVWGVSGSRVHSITFYLQVAPAKVMPTVTWGAPQAITYGTALGASQFNAVLSVPGTCIYSPAAGSMLAVGTHTLTVNCTPSDTYNYSAPSAVSVSLTVNKAPLTITASSPTVVYQSAVPQITPIYTGFVNAETSAVLTKAPTCSTAYASSSAVGSAPSTSCSGGSAANYTLVYQPGSVTIVQASQSITVPSTPAYVTYGASPLTLSATASSGLAVILSGTAGVCTVSGSTLTFARAGVCTVTSNQEGNANYLAAPTVSRTISVNPACLTVTASSPSVVYGSPVPVVTATYAGFVNGDGVSSLITPPACTTAYTPTSPAGSFPATSCSGSVSTKYSFAYVAGKVTVTAATQPITAMPIFSVASGTYSSPQTVTITDATSAAKIYFSTDGSTPTTASALYSGAIAVNGNVTLKAVALAAGYSLSGTASATYTINSSAIDFGGGFTASSGMQLNGKSVVTGGKLQLTDAGANEASSAFFVTPVNVARFSTTFTVQQTSATADGMMFVIQNAGAGPKALGPSGSSLGYSYGPTQPGAILNSVGIKFDLYSNAGEGSNSTGLYQAGARPTSPAVDLTPSGVDLHCGHPLTVQLTYDGSTLQMKITDSTSAKSYTTSWAVNIPQIVGGSTAFVGFTAATGGLSSIQQILNWKF